MRAICGVASARLPKEAMRTPAVDEYKCGGVPLYSYFKRRSLCMVDWLARLTSISQESGLLLIGGARASSRTSNQTEKTSYDGDSGPCS